MVGSADVAMPTQMKGDVPAASMITSKYHLPADLLTVARTRAVASAEDFSAVLSVLVRAILADLSEGLNAPVTAENPLGGEYV